MAGFLVCSLLTIWILAPTKCLGQRPLPDVEFRTDPPTDGGGGGDGDGCVSGEMQVEEQTKGVVRVSELSEGDVILGIKGTEQKLAWCKVLAVVPAAHGEDRITHDGFTADHMVVDNTVHPHGYKGVVHGGPVFTLFTECDASRNAAGQVFTPISTAFCPHELSWGEYLSLIAAIRRVTNRTGNFWFDMDAYHDNATAMVPHWFDQLHEICHQLLRCARDKQCQRFEEVMEEFVREHLNKEYAEEVERVFPNMGGDVDKEQAGTITEVVRQQDRSHIVLFSTLGSAMVVLLIIAAAVLLYRVRLTKKKAEKELEPNHGNVKA